MHSVLEKIINYAIHVTEPEKIILFGSYANGKNDVYSDIDLLIIVNQNYKNKELEMQIASFAREFSLEADILIRTSCEIDRASLQSFSFLGAIIKDGKIVYEKENIVYRK